MNTVEPGASGWLRLLVIRGTTSMGYEANFGLNFDFGFRAAIKY